MGLPAGCLRRLVDLRDCLKIPFWVAQATGLFRRATSRPGFSAASCRRKRAGSPCHPFFRPRLTEARNGARVCDPQRVAGFENRGRVLVTAIVLFAALSQAEVPTLDYLFPAGGQRGTNVTVTVGGKLEPWPAKMWADSPGLEFKAETNKNTFTVQIAKDVPLGVHLVRAYTADGASAPRWFVVGEQRELLEQEPNDNARQAQFIESLPVTINGQLEKGGDVDSFAVKLTAGQWLVAGVEAYGIGSPMDPTLHLLDEHGVRVAYASDTQNADPLLAYRVERSGIYIVQLVAFAHPPQAAVVFTGGKAAVYRLAINAGPLVRFALPGGVQRGRKTELRLYGWNLGKEFLTHSIDLTGVDAPMKQIEIAATSVENRFFIPVGDASELLEVEPNNTPEKAQAVTLPVVVNGRIDPAGDEDRFGFMAKQGEQFDFQLYSARLGFPLDAVLRVEDKAGKQLARDDDSGGAQDPQLSWTAPANGSYVVAVSDLTQKGGSDFVYRLEMKPLVPDFKVALDNHAYRLEAGKTNEIKLTVTRLHGHKAKLEVTLTGLPEGVTAKVAEVPAAGGDVKVTLTATAEAKPASQPFRVLVNSADASAPASHAAAFELRPKDAAGDVLITHTESIWLTVNAKPVVPAAAAGKK